VSRELKSAAFRRVREAEWRELERLTEAVERSGLRGLSAAETARLPLLHRAALASLSVARAVSLDANLRAYLEALAARSHAAVYGARRGRLAYGLHFFAVAFPRAVRANAAATLAAGAALAGGIAAGAAIVGQDLSRYYEFMPGNLAGGRDPSATTDALRAALFGGEGSGAFSGFLFAHNAQIAVWAFLAGVAGGLPSLVLLFQNGLVIGAFVALYRSRGLEFELWGWLLPHGGTELSALILAGGAGIRLGTAIVFPGRKTRRAAMRGAGIVAGLIVMGASAQLALAGVLEGVFRQEVRSTDVRYAVASALLGFWVLYFVFAGRRGDVGSSAP
jgi:uncharacterized membrane protein SpoIIM required for sporulation